MRLLLDRACPARILTRMPVSTRGTALLLPLVLLLASACRGESKAGREAEHAGPGDIRRGRALLIATRDSLPQHVGGNLRCTSCHLNEGRQADAIPLVGVTARYPQYSSRAGAISSIEDRINDCFERSMNGTALPTDSRDMRDMVAYMAYLSQGAPAHGTVNGQGLPPMTPLIPDRPRGARVFAQRCVACHGPRGSGTVRGPALWGPQSYNIGAGMARLRTAASFIRHNMPLDNPSLTDQQAFDVAAYINAQPRPDFAGKAHDWPKGDAPPDVPYRTSAAPAEGTAADAH